MPLSSFLFIVTYLSSCHICFFSSLFLSSHSFHLAPPPRTALAWALIARPCSLSRLCPNTAPTSALPLASMLSSASSRSCALAPPPSLNVMAHPPLPMPRTGLTCVDCARAMRLRANLTTTNVSLWKRKEARQSFFFQLWLPLPVPLSTIYGASPSEHHDRCVFGCRSYKTAPEADLGAVPNSPYFLEPPTRSL
jgi:hypothetical protein